MAAVWQRLFSYGALLALWQLGSTLAEPRQLPSPLVVFTVLHDRIMDGSLPYNIAITLLRVSISFMIAMLLGIAIGIAMGRRPYVDRFFDSWLVLFLNIPALVIIVLCYVWFGLVEWAAILAVTLNKTPNVIVVVREGARALSRDYIEMAEVFHLGRLRTMRHVVLPELTPYIIAAARSGLAITWKIVLVVEMLGRSNGVGFQIYMAFQLFDVPSILAYTVAFVGVIQFIELALLRPADRRAHEWQR
jgi:NitT/TauT family transport system permease protein